MIDRIQGTHTYSTVQYSTYLDGGRNLAPFPESNVATKDHFLDVKVVLGSSRRFRLADQFLKTRTFGALFGKDQIPFSIN